MLSCVQFLFGVYFLSNKRHNWFPSSNTNPTASFVVWSLLVFVVCMSVLCFIFFPKMAQTFSKKADSTRFSIDMRSVDSSKAGRASVSRQGSASTTEGAPERKSSTSFFLDDSEVNEHGGKGQPNDIDSSNRGDDQSDAE